MTFCDIENRGTKELAPGVLMRSFWGEQTTLAVVDLAPNAVVPPHSHPAEQSGIVVNGRIVLTIGEETREIGPGACYIIPGNVQHSLVVGDEPAKLMEVFAPLREELKY